MTESFAIKDSGERRHFESGMVRDTDEGKTHWALVADGPMLGRWAEHLTKGAIKYDARNWMKARGTAEYERFRESAFRHFMQWYYGDRDEDHAAAVFFNINGAEYVGRKPTIEMAGDVMWCNDCGASFEHIPGSFHACDYKYVGLTDA